MMAYSSLDSLMGAPVGASPVAPASQNANQINAGVTYGAGANVGGNLSLGLLMAIVGGLVVVNYLAHNHLK